MKPRVCMCCGEPMTERSVALSRNPNVCASCSSLADGMEDFQTGPALKPAETTLPEKLTPLQEPTVVAPPIDHPAVKRQAA
jgi:hypothetical protein